MLAITGSRSVLDVLLNTPAAASIELPVRRRLGRFATGTRATPMYPRSPDQETWRAIDVLSVSWRFILLTEMREQE
jgi:hypothetical protein